MPLTAQLLANHVYRLDWQRPYRTADWAFLKALVAERSLIQLGESIHMTDEFPRVRLQLVRYLHEQMGFDVLALEGSAVNSWLAQDFVYRSRESMGPKAKRAQE